MKNILNKIFIILILMTFLILIGCEDDAILYPQGDTDECQPGESYCNLSLPGTDITNNINPDIY